MGKGKKTRRLSVYGQVSLDGYFTDENGSIDWIYRDHGDAEFNKFVQENAKGGGGLVFGRVTYEMMASYWPTPLAAETNPVVAERMNAMPKWVVSRTLSQAPWVHTQLLRGDGVEQIRKLKGEPGEDLVILGSGHLVADLTEAGLIDEFQMVVLPIILGKGRSLFEGVSGPLELKPLESRSFKNGYLFLRGVPKQKG